MPKVKEILKLMPKLMPKLILKLMLKDLNLPKPKRGVTDWHGLPRPPQAQCQKSRFHCHEGRYQGPRTIPPSLQTSGTAEYFLGIVFQIRGIELPVYYKLITMSLRHHRFCLSGCYFPRPQKRHRLYCHTRSSSMPRSRCVRLTQSPC